MGKIKATDTRNTLRFFTTPVGNKEINTAAVRIQPARCRSPTPSQMSQFIAEFIFQP